MLRDAFKYLCQNFGPKSLPEYRLRELAPRAWVINPQWHAMDNLAQRLNARAGRLPVRLLHQSATASTRPSGRC